jgi:hypothetical protein
VTFETAASRSLGVGLTRVSFDPRPALRAPIIAGSARYNLEAYSACAVLTHRKSMVIPALSAGCRRIGGIRFGLRIMPPSEGAEGLK